MDKSMHIAIYEAKIISRSPVFRIFVFCVVVSLAFIHLETQSDVWGGVDWSMIALPAQIPFLNAYFFSLLLVIPVASLAAEMVAREKKRDTLDTIRVRNVSNLVYHGGKMVGLFVVLLMTALVSILMALFIHIFMSPATVHFGDYLFYFVTLTIPSLIFLTGFSYAIAWWINNSFLSFLVVLAYGVFSLWLGRAAYGVFDFTSATVSNIFSDFVGHPNVTLYLLHRFFFLFLGIAGAFFIACFSKRLPDFPQQARKYKTIGFSLIFVGLMSGLLFNYSFYSWGKSREEYRKTIERYEAKNAPHIATHEITVAVNGDRMEASSLLCLENKQNQEVDSWSLFLNPGLKVVSIRAAGEDISYSRDRQFIILNRKMMPGEQLSIEIKYRGRIDERIAYLELSEDEYFKNDRTVFEMGYRSAFLSEEYTLLIPEVLWYPVAHPPVIPQAIGGNREELTLFKLTVNGQQDKTILSQGEKEIHGQHITFINQKPLPGITLTIGEYLCKSVGIENFRLEFYYLKGHDFFEQAYRILQDQDITDLYTELRKNEVLQYPFDRLMLVETPASFKSYFRAWKGMSEYVQPELFLWPEQANTFAGSCLDVPFGNETEVEKRTQLSQRLSSYLSSYLFNERSGKLPYFIQRFMSAKQRILSTVYLSNPYYIMPLFYHYNCFIASEKYPILNRALEAILMQEEVAVGRRGDIDREVAQYLSSNSLQDALSDPQLSSEFLNKIIQQKANELFRYIQISSGGERFLSFYKQFAEENSGRVIEYSTFNDQLLNVLNVDLEQFLPEWYYSQGLPCFLIKNLTYREIIHDMGVNEEVSITIHNSGNRKGYIFLHLQDRMRTIEIPESTIIPLASNEIKTITLTVPYGLSAVNLDYGLAENLPSERKILRGQLKQHIQHDLSPFTITDTTRFCVTTVDSTAFDDNSGIVIVDDRDSGFRIIETRRGLLKESQLAPEVRKVVNRRWQYFLKDDFYGMVEQTACMRLAGDGKTYVEWNAEIEKSGRYELWVHKPSNGSIVMAVEDKTLLYYYTLIAEGIEETISLPFFENFRETWISLGEFDLPEGRATLRLSDKGDHPELIICADAIKWVKK